MTADLDMKLVENFCEVDDFVPGYLRFTALGHTLMKVGQQRRSGGEDFPMCLSEQMSILIFFQLSGYKGFKHDFNPIFGGRKGKFPTAVSYSRFITLRPRVVLLLFCPHRLCLLAKKPSLPLAALPNPPYHAALTGSF